MSSSLHSSCASMGANWTGKVYFDPEADKPKEKKDCYFLMNEQFYDSKLFSQFTDPNDKIEKIWYYSHKLFWWQLYQGIWLWHAFIVLKSNHWFWSIEKNSSGITIQRSKVESAVCDKYRGNTRNTPVTLRKESQMGSYYNAAHIIFWINYAEELSKKYRVFDRNCQYFADNIFEFSTKKVYFNPESDNLIGDESFVSVWEVNTRMLELISENDKTETVSYYTDIGHTQAFVMIKSSEWFWSFEQNRDGNTYQRSKHESAVRDKYRGKKRNLSVTVSKEFDGVCPMKDIIYWLYYVDEFYYYYGVVVHNYQDFAHRLFQYTAREEITINIGEISHETQIYIENIETGLVLDIGDANREPNAEIIMYPFHRESNQLWQYNNGIIRSALNNFVLDINQTDCESVVTNPENGNPSQKWYFDSDNTIRSEFRNIVLDINYDQNRFFGKVVASEKQHNRVNQLFRIVKVFDIS